MQGQLKNTALSGKKDGLIKQDRNHIWHPFTQAQISEQPRLIKRAEGALLYTEDGEEIIDATSSWWVTLHGHRHLHIVRRIEEQLQTLEHVMFADFTHAPAIELADNLLRLLPSPFSRVFYSDNGSTAVETAIKMAMQYWYNRDPHTKRKKIIAFHGGYHGDTFGAMSVSQRGIFTRPFFHALFDVLTIDPPIPGREEKSLQQLQALLSKNEIACFIFEPIVQGVAGMKVHSAEGLDALVKLCHDLDVLTIADEVMTGFGRTGPHFAIEHLHNVPDIICLSKGITGGFLPLGATICQERVYEQFLSDQKEKAFLHGHSYCGNPLGCAAGIASLELLDTEGCALQREMIQKQHEEFAKQCKENSKITRTDVIGTILAIEYTSTEESTYTHQIRDKLFSYFRSRNILIRPLGNTIHVIPPYCISEQQLQKVYHAIAHF